MYFMTIYFSTIIIGILDYLQKYYKMTWLNNTFGPEIVPDLQLQASNF